MLSCSERLTYILSLLVPSILLSFISWSVFNISMKLVFLLCFFVPEHLTLNLSFQNL